jgi:hypothetical protein
MFGRKIMLQARIYCVFLFALGLGPGCSGAKEGPHATDPLATVEGFCSAWAKAACNAKVVDACAAPSSAACEASQSAFCSGILPGAGYVSTNASACLSAIGNAYSDARLTAAELLTVRQMGVPCDALVQGPGGAAASCIRSSDCDTVSGLRCLTKGAQSLCGKPEERTGGQSCASPAQLCASGFYCDGDHCIEAPGENESCSAPVPCKSGFRCTGVPDQEQCQAQLGVGSPCEEDSECKGGICQASSATSAVCVDAVILRVGDPLCENLR